jgi:putative nucleotidyltransferase with HDIG domain
VTLLAPRQRLSPPSAFLELHARLRDDALPAGALAEAMCELPDLAAEVLRLANSQLYGMERRVDRLDRAVSLVSTSVLRNLVLSMAMGRAARAMPELGGNLSSDRLRARLVAVARVAGVVARAANVPLEEEARAAGILHDVGLVELALRDGALLQRAHDEAAAAGAPAIEFERARFGVDHAELGREMVDAWKLPEPVVHAVACHHAPLAAPLGLRSLPCLLACAETLCVDGAARPRPPREVLAVLELTPEEWQGLVPALLQAGAAR